MPYITPEQRVRLSHSNFPLDGGELNYLICDLINRYIGVKPNYARMADVKAALMGAYDEFHDRVVRPYEDRKCVENGDVFDVCELG